MGISEQINQVNGLLRQALPGASQYVYSEQINHELPVTPSMVFRTDKPGIGLLRQAISGESQYEYSQNRYTRSFFFLGAP